MLALLGNGISKYLVIGLLATSVALSGLWLYGRVTIANLEQEITVKSTKITQLATELDVQRKVQLLSEAANKKLSERIAQERADALELRDRLKEIEDAPVTSNSGVADVLRNAISRLPNN